MILPLSPEYVPPSLFTSSPTDRRSQLCDDSLNAFRCPGHYPRSESLHITGQVGFRVGRLLRGSSFVCIWWNIHSKRAWRMLPHISMTYRDWQEKLLSAKGPIDSVSIPKNKMKGPETGVYANRIKAVKGVWRVLEEWRDAFEVLGLVGFWRRE